MKLNFDDVLIVPNFSNIKSRKDVDLNSRVVWDQLKLPIISSNMDTVTGPKMAKAMISNGAQSCLHRFQTIEQNVKQLRDSTLTSMPWVSIGLGDNELERAAALFQSNAYTFVIDVAHGASIEVVRQTKALQHLVKNHAAIVVGNFATKDSVKAFLHHLGNKNIDAIKVGIGGGSACTTRLVTGCGMPTLASLLDCKSANIPMIADGGIKNSGDFAKALAAGASAVMLGGMLAGTDESPGEEIRTFIDMYPETKILPGDTILTSSYSQQNNFGSIIERPTHKKYRGSASKESYEVQGKEASWRIPEGESFLVPYKGPVNIVLQELEAGLRSAMSYVGARTLDEFRETAELIQISSNGLKENGAHGVNK